MSSGLAFAVASAQAPVDVREALVIGNSAYAGAPLENPANDAQAMSAALSKLGFSVQVLRDADKRQMTQALDALGARLKGRQGVGMVYYAGHGLQVNYDNFIIPVDARIRQEADIASQAVNVNQALESLAASGSRLSVMVLDACRDNPFKTRQDFVGLAPRDAPKGTLIAYATGPGNVARDGRDLWQWLVYAVPIKGTGPTSSDHRRRVQTGAFLGAARKRGAADSFLYQWAG